MKIKAIKCLIFIKIWTFKWRVIIDNDRIFTALFVMLWQCHQTDFYVKFSSAGVNILKTCIMVLMSFTTCSFLWRALHKDVTKNTFIILPTCSHFTVNRLLVKIQTVIVTLRRGKLAFTHAGPPQREGLSPHQPFSRTCSFSPKHECRRPPEGPRPLWGWQLEDTALRTPADTLTSAVDTADTEYSTTKTPQHNAASGTSEK